MKLHPKKLPRSVAPNRKMHLVAAALLVASACSKPSAEQTPASEMTEAASTAQQAITEAHVQAIANEIREAHLQLDVERFVAPFANDAEITFVPLNGKTAVMEREIIKPYLESVWAKTKHPEYRTKNERVTISGDEAKYSATVVESFLLDGARQHQTTDQNWDIELRDEQPSITGMHMQVVSR